MAGQTIVGKLEILTSELIAVYPLNVRITLDGDKDGDIIIKNNAGKDTIILNGSEGNGQFGGNGVGGVIVLTNAAGKDTIKLNGAGGNCQIGGNGFDGAITLKDNAGQETVLLHGAGGNVNIVGRVGIGTKAPEALLHLNGTGNDEWGMILSSTAGSAKGLKINTAWHGHENISLLEVSADVRRFDIRANGNTYFYRDDGSPSIHLDSNAGDIKLLGADCAEDFDVEESHLLEPGTVMVLDQKGKLQQSNEAYDKKVVGVISGGGDCKPGIVLDKKHSQKDRLPLALVGKVYCKVDAQYSPIEIGDLLTTSPTPGYAMKADDPFKAFGAVIGKALRALSGGQGLIPILVALQ